MRVDFRHRSSAIVFYSVTFYCLSLFTVLEEKSLDSSCFLHFVVASLSWRVSLGEKPTVCFLWLDVRKVITTENLCQLLRPQSNLRFFAITFHCSMKNTCCCLENNNFLRFLFLSCCQWPCLHSVHQLLSFVPCEQEYQLFPSWVVEFWRRLWFLSVLNVKCLNTQKA